MESADMSNEQFEPYPGSGRYEPFGPGQPQGGKPTPPQTVIYAFYLMLAGAALTLAGVLYGLTQYSQTRERALRAGNGNLTDRELDMIVEVSFVVGIVAGLISVGLWIWMAYKNRAGRNWARVTSTVFFGLYTASLALTGAIGNSPAISIAFTILTWLVGLATAILLWLNQSSASFHPAPTPTPYLPGPYGG
ncbi:hypothetical protein NSK11_contig00028-0013 [Nocardia seriolae]|uniref:Uncharacterized protein n=2 Tax=Nocardia seriolae TaxID=37332 RepID=A0ABC9YS48_9NOCA|nr:hypothetical protein NS07_v2contig00023-0012 [Nocardia seriolae]GAP28100.1 hypothetical protein NSK11_contig00028-0013 [Nocardia seriolae]